MRRAFFHIHSKLRQSENDELQKTLKYLTGSLNIPSKSLSSLFTGTSSTKNLTDVGNGNANEKEKEKKKIVRRGIGSPNAPHLPPIKPEHQVYRVKKSVRRDQDQNHIDTIVKALNLTLPDTSKNTERIQRHYDFYFERLRTILETSSTTFSNNNTSSSSNTHSHTDVDTSQQLFDKLVLLQLTDNFNINKAAKIVLSKKFKHYSELWKNILVFSPIDRAQLALLLYYRTHDANISYEYGKIWMDRFLDFEVSIQRVFWRCMYDKRDVVASKRRIYDALSVIRQHWKEPRDLVVLYQAVFELAHELPLPLPLPFNEGSGHNSKDTRLLFIDVLRLLGPYGSTYKEAAAEIVKLSIETRLQDTEEESTTQRYKFNTSLALQLQSIRSQCSNDPNNSDEVLENELNKILRRINDERGEITLKFA